MKLFAIALAAGLLFAAPAFSMQAATHSADSTPAIDRLLVSTEQVATDALKLADSMTKAQADCKAIHAEQPTDADSATLKAKRVLVIDFCISNFGRLISADNPVVAVRFDVSPKMPAEVPHHPWLEDEAEGCWGNEEALENLVNLQTAIRNYESSYETNEALARVKSDLALEEPGLRAEHARCYAPGTVPEYKIPALFLEESK